MRKISQDAHAFSFFLEMRLNPISRKMRTHFFVQGNGYTLSNSSSENSESLLAMKTYSNPKNYHAQNP